MKTKELISDIKIMVIGIFLAMSVIIVAHAFIYSLNFETSLGESLGMILANLFS